jgi:hypothetical protein
MHRLERKNPVHRWLLHHLFLDEINADCEDFVRNWNAKPISGEKGKSESPAVKRLRGQAFHGGVYLGADNDIIDPDEAGLSVEDIVRSYGIHGPRQTRRDGDTGAGELSDEDVPSVDDDVDLESEDELDEESAETWEELQQLEENVGHHFVQKPVQVPRAFCPFTDEGLKIFDETLEVALQEGPLPEGYGILPTEWPEGTYPSAENIKSGKKGTKELRVELPSSIWKPRAERWVQALYILNRMNDTFESETM